MWNWYLFFFVTLKPDDKIYLGRLPLLLGYVFTKPPWCGKWRAELNIRLTRARSFSWSFCVWRHAHIGFTSTRCSQSIQRSAPDSTMCRCQCLRTHSHVAYRRLFHSHRFLCKHTYIAQCVRCVYNICATERMWCCQRRMTVLTENR